MNPELLERILNCPTLPTLPAVAVKVLELTRRRNVSVEELAATIQNDQGLTAKVLKTVNSSFYGLRKPCANINQAIVMLGLSAVKSLTLGFSLVTALSTEGAAEFDFVSYWRRGLHAAVGAKCIAHEAGLATEDEAFLGGLLQDVGMVAMFHGLGRKYLEVMLQNDGDHRTLVKHEIAELELHHPEIGALMCERWKLPMELLIPVRFHERPTAAPEEFGQLVRSIGLANIAHAFLDGDVSSLARFNDKGARWFKFDTPVCDAILRRIADGTREVAPLFQLNAGAPVDLDQLLEQARAQLNEIEAAPDANQRHGASMSSLVSDSDEHDALTGAASSQAILREIETLFGEAAGKRKSLAVIGISLDRFALLVEQLGAEAGDAALVELSMLLGEIIEPLGGVVARWEGPMFLLALPGVDRAEAARIAAEIRSAVRSQSTRWDIPGETSQFAVSVGATAFDGRKSFTRHHQLIASALRAMEGASESGGDCVRTFVPKAAA
jgi:diguanylate cyclase (GGDEF)-like protein